MPSPKSSVLHVKLVKIAAFLHVTSKTYIKGDCKINSHDHQAPPQGSTLPCIWDNGLVASSVPSAPAYALELMCICLFVELIVCACVHSFDVCVTYSISVTVNYVNPLPSLVCFPNQCTAAGVPQ